jgi:hypothetical protein
VPLRTRALEYDVRFPGVRFGALEALRDFLQCASRANILADLVINRFAA